MARMGGDGGRARGATGAGGSCRDALSADAGPFRKRGAVNWSIERLTFRECEVLEALLRGLTNKQIAARMFLAEKTVKNYVSRLLAKLGMERRTQAAVFVSRLENGRRTDR